MAHNKKRKKIRGSVNVVTSCISTTLVLVLLGSVVFFVHIARNFSHNIKENFAISLLLDDEISKDQIKAFQDRIEKLPCTKEVNFISKEKALEIQSEALGTDPTEFMKENPMPASFEIHLKADYTNRDSLIDIIPALKKEQFVLEISYPENLMDSLNENIRRLSTVMLIVALLLAFVSFALINNTIRLSVHSRRFLIYTMALVGASWSFIRRPFIAQAFWIGFASAMMASALLLAGIYAIETYEPNMIELVTASVLGITISTIFVCGMLLTLLCAYFSVNHNLNLSYDKLNRF